MVVFNRFVAVTIVPRLSAPIDALRITLPASAQRTAVMHRCAVMRA